MLGGFGARILVRDPVGYSTGGRYKTGTMGADGPVLEVI